jgi:hypothetical protein
MNIAQGFIYPRWAKNEKVENLSTNKYFLPSNYYYQITPNN